MRRASFIIGVFLSLILTLAGCRKDIVLQQELNFSAKMWDEAQSKAMTITSSNLTTSVPIEVHSYFMNGVGAGCTAQEFFSENLQYSGGSWNTVTTQYWPSSTNGSTPTNSLSFFALHPSTAIASWNDASFLTGEGYPSFTFTTEQLLANQKDLILSSALYKTVQSGEVDGRVDFDFHHLLTKIGIVTRIVGSTPTPPTVVIKSIKIIGVYPTATYNINTGWNSVSGTPTTYIARDTDLTLTSIYQNVMGDNQFMFLIPQSLTGIALEVKYSVGDNPVDTQYVSLSSSETWTAGKGIGLDITYSVDPDAGITFSLNIVDWSTININTTIL